MNEIFVDEFSMNRCGSCPGNLTLNLLYQLNLIELDLRNNHFTKLPIINDTITNFKIDGNLFVYSGPFLGNKHILKDNMFKRKAKSLPEIHPVVAIETTGTSDQITSFASKSQISTSQLSVQSKSSQIKSSKSSENIIKSDIIPTSASEPNLVVGDKSVRISISQIVYIYFFNFAPYVVKFSWVAIEGCHQGGKFKKIEKFSSLFQKNKLDARRIALKNFVEIQKENLRSAQNHNSQLLPNRLNPNTKRPHLRSTEK